MTDMARLPSMPDPLQGMLDELVFNPVPSSGRDSNQLHETQADRNVNSFPESKSTTEGQVGVPSPVSLPLEPNAVGLPSSSAFALPDLSQASGQGSGAPDPVFFPMPFPGKGDSEEQQRRRSCNSSDHTDFAESGSGAPHAKPDKMQIRRSGRQRKRSTYVPTDSDEEWAPVKEKRPVGRPIAYRGDPESPHLSEAERRQIKRRIANRDSARRVRQRKQDDNADLQKQLHQSLDREKTLMQHIKVTERNTVAMRQQVETLQSQLQAASPAHQPQSHLPRKKE